MAYSIYLTLWFTVAIPAIVGVVYFKKLAKPSRIIATLMCIGLITEFFLVFTHKNNNLYIVYLYTFLEVISFAWFFLLIVQSQKAKKIIKISAAFVLTTVLAEAFFGNIYEWNTISSALEGICIIGFGLYYFYELALAINKEDMQSNPDFWLTGVILFYFMSSLGYFLLSRYATNLSREVLVMLSNVHTFVNAFCNIGYTIILWKFTRSYSLAP